MKLADYTRQKLMKMRLPLKKFAKITVILQSPTTTCTLEVYDNSQCFVVIFLDLLFLSLIFQFPRPIHLERTCSTDRTRH